MDIYRQPEKLLEAMEALTPIMTKMGVGSAQMNGRPFIFIPLHKGADGFLSDAQFKRFYWPTLRKVIMGLIDEGVVPLIAAEGGWESRLEVISDLPRGKTLWMIDQTDMTRAKKTLGAVACLAGNVPCSMLLIGTPQQVGDYARKLIGTCAKDGGYIMSNGAFFDEAKAENVRAMVECGQGVRRLRVDSAEQRVGPGDGQPADRKGRPRQRDTESSIPSLTHAFPVDDGTGGIP